MIVSDAFDKFTVYYDTDAYQFQYITIEEKSFYEDFSKYILDFSMIKKHANINLGIGEELSLQDYNNIYDRLLSFVDFERIYDITSLDDSIIEILDDELIKGTKFRKDKWGKIGEYIFNIILDSYFNLDCIIRKFTLNTSRNVSVYGIDTVHCSLKDKTLYFGESKMVDNTKVDLHSLRHTFATRCIESGMQAKVLQHILGHKDITTTYNTYGDVFDKFECDNITKAEIYMKENGLKIY